MERFSSGFRLPNVTAHQVKSGLSNQCLYLILLGLSFDIYKTGTTMIRTVLWIW